MGAAFSGSSFAVAAFSVAAFAFGDSAPVVTVTPEQPRYSASLASQTQHWQQLHEEDEVLLTVLQHFVMEA